MRCFRLFTFSLQASFPRSVNQFFSTQSKPTILWHQPVLSNHRALVRFAHNNEFNSTSDSEETLESPLPGQSILCDSHRETVRNPLYTTSDDPVVLKLRTCKKYDELVSTFQESTETHTPQQIIQAILSLWDIEDNVSSGRGSSLAGHLLTSLASVQDKLSLEELSYGLVYLTKLLENPYAARSLAEIALERTREEEIDLPTLSRLNVILNTLREIPYFYTYPILLPRIDMHVRRRDLSEEDLLHITVAMKQFTRHLSPDLMSLYRSQVESFEQRGTFSDSGSNSKIIKVCNLLNSSPWSMENSKLIRTLMHHVQAKELELQDLTVAFKITQSQLEPRPLIGSILKRALELKREDTSNLLLWQCEVIQTLPEARKSLVDTLEQYLSEKKEQLSTEDVLIVFKILRQAKVSKSRLCNIYWNKVLDKIKEDPGEQDSDRLIHHCHRYMYFNNNLGGTYRYFAFERFALDLIMIELREGMSQFIPAQLARLSSFLIGYGTSEKIPQMILDKLIACKDQLNFFDCLQLSRGIQIALELRFRKGLPHEFARQVQVLESAIDESILRRLQETKELSIIDANIIMRGYTMRKSTKSSEVIKRIVQRYEEVDFEITSRIIRDTTMNLSLSRIKSPKLHDAFLDFLVDNQSSITGDITEKILHSCYSLGHETNNFGALKVGAEIVERDFDFMTGLAIVNSCLSLCYYGCLSKELMTKIFCISFIKRLEDEIKMCYSKATYPAKVLNKVMQLNRSVCLDYPEYNVPWFQQNYVEAQTTKSSPNEVFQQDVLHRLKQIFRDDIEKIELNHSTAYGYRLDFLLKINNLNRLLPKDAESPARRLAVMLLGLSSYCTNSPADLCGYEQLRRRHLEILGFEVLEISYRDWTTSKINLDALREQFIQRNVEIVQ